MDAFQRSGDVSIYIHAVRIEAPVRNQQSQIHSAVQKVLKEVKGADPSAQFLSNADEPIETTVPADMERGLHGQGRWLQRAKMSHAMHAPHP